MNILATVDLQPVTNEIVSFSQAAVQAAGVVFIGIIAYVALTWGAKSLWNFFRSMEDRSDIDESMARGEAYYSDEDKRKYDNEQDVG